MRRFISFVLSIGLGVALLVAVGGGTASAAPPEGAGFQSVQPTRVLDTRDSGQPVGPKQTIPLDLAGKVPPTATAVILNITGTQPTAQTWITVYQAGIKRPLASNLNLVPGENRPNLVTIGLGDGQKVNLYNEAGTVHLIADLTGYYAPEAPGKYTPLPARPFLDAQLGPNSSTTVDLTGRIPASATAVTFNLKGSGANDITFVTAWPNGTPRPNTSNLNIAPGQTSTNQVTVAVPANRKLDVFNWVGNITLHADLAGFYTPDYGSLFSATSPLRVLDTRDGTGGTTGPIGPGRGFTVNVGANITTTASAVVLNVTGTSPTANTNVTVWSNLPPNERPTSSSNLNLAPNQTAPNLVTTGVGGLGSVNFFNEAGNVQLVADLAGYFQVPQPQCGGTKCVHSWGTNTGGSLGTGTYSPNSVNPWPVYRLTNVKAVGDRIALRTDGTVWAWGPNGARELGNGWQGGYSLLPVPVLGLTNIVAIERGLALRNDGTVWAWGRTPGFEEATPVQVPQLSNIVDISVESQTAFAVRDDGTVWAWGSNVRDGLGIGAPHGAFITVPTQMPNMTGAKSVTATGLGGYVVKTDGTVWSWGTNANGQLGNGTVGENCQDLPPAGPNCMANEPVQVAGLTDVTAVAADTLHGFAVKTDGTVWGWGNNRLGGLGNGQDCEACNSGTPTQVSGLANARSVAAFGSGGYALDADGRVWAWGSDGWRLGPVDPRPPLDYSTVALRLREPVGVTAIGASPLGTGFALVG